jgi:hypothetical protein
MRNKLSWLAVVAVLIAGCSGGGTFIPDNKPFTGQFIVNGAAIGNFSFTATAESLGGTGTLVHNEQPVTVAISAALNSKSFTGTVQNASLGGGTFSGAFKDGNQASGTFTYQDAGQISTQSGTWQAATAP